MSKLPIKNSTLLYGSSDAGKTVKMDAKVNTLVFDIATKLNLSPHQVKKISKN